MTLGLVCGRLFGVLLYSKLSFVDLKLPERMCRTTERCQWPQLPQSGPALSTLSFHISLPEDSENGTLDKNEALDARRLRGNNRKD